jgi:hypothetical protein
VQEIHGKGYLPRAVQIKEMEEREMKLGLAKWYVYRRILPNLVHPEDKKPLLEGNDRDGYTSTFAEIVVRNGTVSLRPGKDPFLNRVKECVVCGSKRHS